MIFARKPFHFLARAVAFDVEFRASHVFELDLDGIARIDRHQSLVKRTGGDDVARTQPEKLRQPGNLIRNFMRHRAGIVVLPRLTVIPRFYDDVVGIGNFVLGDDPRPAATM